MCSDAKRASQPELEPLTTPTEALVVPPRPPLRISPQLFDLLVRAARPFRNPA